MRIGEHIGAEDRGTEFKDGQGFIDIDFRASVAKYVSAFVNSHAHGTLFAGVNNAGHVTGYEINQSKEDRLRLQIDEAIKDIKPNIFPNDYSVVFIPVTDQNGYLADGYRTGRYTVVICIDVNGDRVSRNDQLYRTLQGTFMRRDGSVQTLNSQDIHEFYQRRNQSEMDRLRNDLKQRNKQKDNEFDRKMREIENRHKQTEESFERERRELLAKTSEQQEVIERFKQQREENEEVRGSEELKQTEEESRKPRGITDNKSKFCTIS